jgi:hypothetical protein
VRFSDYEQKLYVLAIEWDKHLIFWEKVTYLSMNIFLVEERKKMRIRVLHLWIPAAISYCIAMFMSFSREHVGALLFTALYMSLLICTKWAGD